MLRFWFKLCTDVTNLDISLELIKTIASPQNPYSFGLCTAF